MKLPTKLLLTLMGLVGIIVLGFVGWSTKAKSDATFHLANGVEVTPIEVKSDDMAQLLEAKIWKFDVVRPTNANTFERITLYQKGKPSRQISTGMGWSPAGGGAYHSHITVGLIPVTGTFRDASELKFYLSNGGGFETGRMPNPFIRSRGVTTWNPEAIANKNTVLFVSGSPKGGGFSDPPSRNEIALALDFEAIPYKK